MSQYLMNTYNRLPITLVRGAGVWVWDSTGKRYLDALAGIAVNSLGHAHPQWVASITDQVGKLAHASNLYSTLEQEQLAAELTRLSGMDKVFFCNSGCEANEAAIKLARLYGHQKGVQNPAIVVMEKSFHGRTMATLSATGSRKVQAGFEPLMPGFVRVPFDDLVAVEQVAAHHSNVVGVLVEPVQGEGGINIPADASQYLAGLRRLCDQYGWLLMLDEVQSGIARTGTWFAFQHSQVMPDVMTLAKGLGSGFPIGACLAKGSAAEVFTPGKHGSTFGGNPLACCAALTTLKVIAEYALCSSAQETGDFISEELTSRLSGTPGVVGVRHAGLMIGIEFSVPCGDLVLQALEAGLLINVTADKVVRLLPPLILSQQEAMLLVDMLVPLIQTFCLARV